MKRKIFGSHNTSAVAESIAVDQPKRSNTRPPQIEELESRIMYSADVHGLPLPHENSEIPDTETDFSRLLADTIDDSYPHNSPGSTGLEVIFIDSGIPDANEINDDLISQQNAGRTVHIVTIEASDDGIEKITTTLLALNDVSAVHIISHGTETGILLGDTWLDRTTAESYASDIAQWQNVLTGDADLLLYGCNLAASTEGLELLSFISEHTGADIAASQNSTGHALTRGDWELEYSSGKIETEIALSQVLQQNWNYQLQLETDLLATDDLLGDQLINNPVVINDPALSDTNILSNDTPATTLELVSVSSAAKGTISTDGTLYTYSPNTGASGGDSFEYTITDTSIPIRHYFPLDSNDITDAFNRTTVISDPSNHPTLVGDTLVFDGDDFIEIPDVEYTPNFTISFDFKVDSFPNTKQQLFQHGYWSRNNSITAWIENNELQFALNDLNDEGDESIFNINPDETVDLTNFIGQWKTLTFTHNGGSTGPKEFKAYLDDQELSIYEENTHGTDSFNPNTSIYIGKYLNSYVGDQTWLIDHSIKNLRIYDDVLLPEDVEKPVISTGSVSLNLKGINEAPVFISLDDSPAFIEGQANPIVLDGDVKITDPDTQLSSEPFNNATLTLQREAGANVDDEFSHGGLLSPLIDNGPLTYNSINIGTVSQNSNGVLELTFNSNADNNLVDKTLQSIHYYNTSQTPPETANIKWTFNDGFSGDPKFGTSETATGNTIVQIEATTDIAITLPASLTLQEDATYTFNNDITTAHDLDQSLTVSSELTVVSGSLSVPAASILAAGPDLIISGNDTNALTLTGPVDAINTALQTLTYISLADFHGTDTLTLTTTAGPSNASESGSTEISINAVNDAPGITNAQGVALLNINNSTPVKIDTDISITDVDILLTDNYSQSILTLNRVSSTDYAPSPQYSANPYDVFTSAMISGNTVKDSGVDFGTVVQNNNGLLEILFLDNATSTKINSLLQSIHYNNTAWSSNTSQVISNWPHDTVDLQWKFEDKGANNSGSIANSSTQVATAISTIDITTSEPQPIRIADRPLTIVADSSAQVIDNQYLNHLDLDTPDSNLVYTITDSISNELNLTNNNTPLGLNSTFTQADINQNLIKVSSSATNDSYLEIEYTATGNTNSYTGIFQIFVIIDIPTKLQAGIKLNQEDNGGNNAYLKTDAYNFVQGNEQLTWEFMFSGLQVNPGNQPSTLYSAAAGTHYEHLSIRPDLNGTLINGVPVDGFLEWNSHTFTQNNPDISLRVPGVFDGEPHSVALTLDVTSSGNREMKLFADGVLQNTYVHGQHFPGGITDGVPWIIGQQLAPTTSATSIEIDQGKHFSGVLHNVRVWDTNRSQTEINDSRYGRFDNGLITPPNLLIDWQMNDGSGDQTITQVTDSAANAPDATLEIGYATGPGFTPSTVVDEIAVDDTVANNTVIGFVTPIDPNPDAGGYNYTIASGPTPFSIDPVSGMLSVSDNTLLPETGGVYDLVIRVESTSNNKATLSEVSVRINPVNEPPTFNTISNPVLTITENDPPVTLNPAITITDDELNASSFDGSSLIIQRSNSSVTNSSDNYSYDSLSGSAPFYTVHETTGRLEVTFNANASQDSVNEFLQSIRYQNTSEKPDANIRLEWKFNDGNIMDQGSGGALDDIIYTDITIVPVNDPPTANGKSITFLEDTSYPFIDSDFGFSDQAEDNNPYKLEITNLPSNGSLWINNTTELVSPATIFFPVTDSQLKFIPQTNSTTATSFDFIVFDDGGIENDGINYSEPSTITLELTPVNDPPEAKSFEIDVLEGYNYPFETSEFGITDPDNTATPFSIHINSLPIEGALYHNNIPVSEQDVIYNPNLLEYRPPVNTEGTVETSFDYFVKDTDGTDNGGSDTSEIYTITINNIGVNDPPEAETNSPVTVLEDSSYTFNIGDFPFTDTDDHLLLNVILDTNKLPTNGSLLFDDAELTSFVISADDIVTGRFSYRPAPNINGTDSFDYKLQDNGGVLNNGIDISNSRALGINILSVNDAPLAAHPDIIVTEGSTYDFNTAQFGFSDPVDGDSLFSIQIHSLPADGDLYLDGGPVSAQDVILDPSLLEYRPPQNTQGTVSTSFEYVVKDNGGTDNGGSDTSEIYTITINNIGVNDPPEAETNSPVTVLEDSSYTFNIGDFPFTDTDDHLLLNVILDTNKLPTNGSLLFDDAELTSFVISADDIVTGRFSYRPAPNINGTDSFDYKLQDNGGVLNNGIDISNSRALGINILSVNDAPLAAHPDIIVTEGSTYDFNTAQFGFSDPVDSDSLSSIQIHSLPTDGDLYLDGVLVSAQDVILDPSLLEYRPPQNTQGTVSTSFEYVVKDNGGTDNGGSDTSEIYTITINNIGVNDPPEAETNSPVTVLEDSSYTFNIGDFPFTDTDDHLLLNVILDTNKLPTNGSLLFDDAELTSFVISADDIITGRFSYRPAPNINGTDSFDYKLQDNGGVLNNGIDISNSRALGINILSVNDAPLAAHPDIIVTEGSTYDFNTAQFGFSDPVDGDSLFSIQIHSLPADGDLYLDGVLVSAQDVILDPSLLEYRPPQNTQGTVSTSFEYVVKDNGGTDNGGSDTSEIYTITINNIGVNDPPEAETNSPVTVLEDSSYTFNIGDFPFTDTDDHLLLNVILDTNKLPTNGSLLFDDAELTSFVISADDIVTGRFSYRPAPNINGTDSFDYKLQDNGGVLNNGIDISNSRALGINILSVNDAPLAAHPDIIVTEGSTYDFNTAQFGFSDPVDGDRLLEIQIESTPLDGGLYLNNTQLSAPVTLSEAELNQLEYRPPVNTTGTVDTAFTYSVRDDGGTDNNGSNNSAINTITITNIGVNDPPTGTDSIVSTAENSPYTLKVEDFGFQDNDGDSFNLVTIKSVPTYGTLTLNGIQVISDTQIFVPEITEGHLVFTPASGTVIYDSFSFVVHDDGGTLHQGADTAISPNSVTIVTLPDTTIPTGNNGSVTVIEDTPYEFLPTDFGLESSSNSLIQIIIQDDTNSGTLDLDNTLVSSGSFISQTQINAGNFSYIPQENTHGLSQDSFSYFIWDNENSSLSAYSIEISITAVNDRPEGKNKQLNILEDTAVTLRGTDFGFSDVDDDLLHSILFNGLPQNGQLLLNNRTLDENSVVTVSDLDAGLLQFVPEADRYGQNLSELLFQVIDNSNHPDLSIDDSPNLISINVQSISDAPTAINNNITINEDESYTLTVSDFSFLDNADLPNVNNFTAILITSQPASGTLLLANTALSIGSMVTVEEINNGKLEFTPVTNEFGAQYATFNFKVVDDGNDSNVSVQPNTLTFNVNASNDAPTTEQLEHYTTNENKQFELLVPIELFHDPDPGDTLVFSTNGLPEWISLTQTNQHLSFKGIAEQAGTFVIRIIATDEEQASTYQDLTITVIPNEPTIAAAQPTAPTAELLNKPSNIGQNTSIAMVPTSSPANASATTARPEIHNRQETTDPEDIYVRLDIPESVNFVSIPVFQTPSYGKPAAKESSTEESAVVKLEVVENSISLNELLGFEENPLFSSDTGFVNKLDDNSDLMSNIVETDLRIASAAAGASAGLSIGYIAWLLRSGLLLSSVLSSLPAWRSLDPLPVLSSLDDNQTNDNDMSLEDMVTRENKEHRRETDSVAKENADTEWNNDETL